ncbi:MAG: glycosyltransferase family 4 protein [Chloroflexota bacterium]|nr:glycosyltransferase family 4 protein [Chloroflexota bacterium]
MLIGVDASRITRPTRTGVENYSLHVLRHLLSDDQRNAYRLYLSQPLVDGLVPLGPRTSTRLIQLPRLWTHLGLSSEMLVSPPDVLFVPSHVLPLVTSSRSVVVVYDVGHRFFPRAHRLTEWLYVEWAIRRHVRIATRLVTISEASKRDLVRVYGADPARIAVAYPAVEERFMPASGAEVARVRARYGLGERYVLHLGTVKPRKNLPRLVRAFASANLPADTQLVLGGTTTFGGRLVDEAIDQAGIATRVRRLAYVPDADLAGLYGGAACAAIVSLYEGFGMPALEALACAAPLVASNRGSLPEIVGDAALVVDPLAIESIAAGLERAVGDTVVRSMLQARGPLRAAAFDWASAAIIIRQVLEQASAPEAHRPPRCQPPFAAR